MADAYPRTRIVSHRVIASNQRAFAVIPHPTSLRYTEVRVLCTDWVPRVETKLTSDLLTLTAECDNRTRVKLLIDATEVQLPSEYRRVLALMQVGVEDRKVNFEDEREMPTLIYYTRKADKPAALCSREKALYRYVGQEANERGPHFSTTPSASPVFKDPTRPLPANQNLNSHPPATSLNFHSVLPAWLRN
jgi:hypothetical protein